jgi:cation-transporting ATPase E
VLRSVMHFVVPAAFTVAAISLTIYLAFLLTTKNLGIAQSALTTTTVLCGIILISFVEPPTPTWVGGDELSGDWRPTLLALGMLALYGLVMFVPVLRSFFELTPLRELDWLLISIAVGAWALVLRFMWRARVLERLLQLE